MIGFSNNPRSLSGAVQGASRFYFDGAGTIVGVSTPAGGNVAIPTQAGNYTVNSDCTGTLTLTGGASFDIVVASQGTQILFVETDSANIGSVGTLQRASSCVSLDYPQSYAFSFFGVSPASSSSSTGGTTGTTGGTTGTTGGTTGTTGGTTGTTGGTTGTTGGTTGTTGGTTGTTGGTTGTTGGTTGTTGGTTGTTGGTTGTTGGTTGTTGGTTGSVGAFSQIGTIATDGSGSFTFTSTSVSGGTVSRAKGGGTYSVGADCSLKLNFSSTFPGTTPNFKAPLLISGLTTDASGGVLIQQPNATTAPLTGTFTVQ